MPELEIEKLTLRLAGLSEEEGRRLARLIADGLAASPLRDGTAGQDAVATTLTGWPGMGLEDISNRIVADLLRQLL